MLFNSLEFLHFIIIVFCLYYLLPNKYKLLFLLFASWYFYFTSKPIYLLLFIFCLVVNYIFGLYISEFKEKRRLFIAAVVFNLFILGFYKYFNFFISEICSFLEIFSISYEFKHYNIILPLGISFYTFQMISYIFDVYKSNISPCKSFYKFALYISFFPRLIAGPIVRAEQMLPQFESIPKFDIDKFKIGIFLIFFGLIKKIMFADYLSIYVDSIYQNPGGQNAFKLLIATYAFAFQIYLDFSAYSDIARGLGNILGYDLPINFRQPYLSFNVQEFWRNWHITLSSWLRDYLYIPLGGNRKGVYRTYYNVFLVMFLGGLWHGAGWTFIIWGSFHGIMLIIHKLFSFKFSIKKIKRLLNYNLFNKVFKLASIVTTFHLVCIGWIFFKANSLNDAFIICNNLFIVRDFNFLKTGISTNIWSLKVLIICIAMYFLHFLERYVSNNKDILFKKWYNVSAFVRGTIYAIIVLGFFILYRSTNAFIYLQF